MPTAAMWEKVRVKYKNAKRMVLTWNPSKNAGGQVEWPWRQTEPPLFAIKWTVIGAPAWYDFDVEREGIAKRNFASSFKKTRKSTGGNKRASMDPKRL